MLANNIALLVFRPSVSKYHLEPAIRRGGLTAECSTIELLRSSGKNSPKKRQRLYRCTAHSSTMEGHQHGNSRQFQVGNGSLFPFFELFPGEIRQFFKQDRKILPEVQVTGFVVFQEVEKWPGQKQAVARQFGDLLFR